MQGFKGKADRIIIVPTIIACFPMCNFKSLLWLFLSSSISIKWMKKSGFHKCQRNFKIVHFKYLFHSCLIESIPADEWNYCKTKSVDNVIGAFRYYISVMKLNANNLFYGTCFFILKSGSNLYILAPYLAVISCIFLSHLFFSSHNSFRDISLYHLLILVFCLVFLQQLDVWSLCHVSFCHMSSRTDKAYVDQTLEDTPYI